jgi:hypothetical protein
VIPIPILLGLHALFGLAVAYASRTSTRLSSRSVLTSRAYLALLVSEGMLGVPIAIYLYVFYRDWSFMYLVDGARVPSALAVAIVATYPAIATAAYVLGVALLRARRDALLGGLVVGVMLASAGVAVVLRGRLLLVGPFGGYHGGYGMRALTRSALAPVGALLSGTLFAGWAYVVWRTGRETRPPSP